jgi:hypothetical protein
MAIYQSLLLFPYEALNNILRKFIDVVACHKLLVLPFTSASNNIEDFSINMKKLIVLLFFAFVIKGYAQNSKNILVINLENFQKKSILRILSRIQFL